MASGGFNLRKWHTNSKELMKAIGGEEQSSVSTSSNQNIHEEDLSFTKSSVAQESKPASDSEVKVLGSIWNIISDTLLFNFDELIAYAKSLSMTKISLLKWSSKIFDPLGLLTPFTIKLKMLFQEMCLTKTNWDDEVDDKTRREWNTLLSELSHLSRVPVSRCYFVALLKPATVQIHGFSDASERAYAAVAYLRTVYENGYIDVKLIASKAKVAPAKTPTIPRLELLGATILARLMNKLSASLSLEAKLFYWVDSTAVLCWIRNERLWRQYIQNRVNEIRSLSSPDIWHFCPGSLNPADLPSRGMADKVCDPESVWYNGPGFLSQPDNEWPVDPANVSTESSEVLSEVLKQPPNVVRSLPVNSQESNEPEANIDAIIDINRFGNFNKLLRVTAHVMKFINKLKQSRELRKQGRERSRNKESNSLLASEIELMRITCIQKASFKTELEFLGRKTNRSMPQYVSQFGLYLDKNRVLRCKGRLDKSGMEFGTRHPVLLPPKHPFVELIIRDVHERVKHSGIRDTLTTIRERFWIIRGRESVKRLIKGCVICRKAE